MRIASVDEIGSEIVSFSDASLGLKMVAIIRAYKRLSTKSHEQHEEVMLMLSDHRMSYQRNEAQAP